ncbi:CinA family protein [Falsiroseomonas sp.]|uniref:CinA family protein n=1 Tax=Falsiroseomonas sp. TaxID=2870721 RepID=UPI003F6F4AE1
MQDLLPIAARIGELLKARGETVAVSESAAGGLVAASLLALPGASAYFRGGAVVYTAQARGGLLGITHDDMRGMRSASEPYAALCAATIRRKLDADWGVAETGAAGPSGNRYGDAAGHACLAVTGAVTRVTTLETGSADRADNMRRFAAAALILLEQAITDAG